MSNSTDNTACVLRSLLTVSRLIVEAGSKVKSSKGKVHGSKLAWSQLKARRERERRTEGLGWIAVIFRYHFCKVLPDDDDDGFEMSFFQASDVLKQTKVNKSMKVHQNLHLLSIVLRTVGVCPFTLVSLWFHTGFTLNETCSHRTFIQRSIDSFVCLWMMVKDFIPGILYLLPGSRPLNVSSPLRWLISSWHETAVSK